MLSLAKDIQERLYEVIDNIAQDPRPPGSKKLTAKEGYRIRKGDWRILYAIDDHKKLVCIYRIGLRRDVYR